MPPTPPGSNSSPNWCRRCPQIQDTSTGNPAFLTEVSQNSGHLHRILRLNPQARAVAQVPPSSGAGPFCWLRRSPFFRSRCLLLVAQVPLLPEQVPSAGGAGPPSSRASPLLPAQVPSPGGAGPFCWWRRSPGQAEQVCFSLRVLLRQSIAHAFQRRRSPTFFRTCARQPGDLRQECRGPAPGMPGTCTT